MAEPTKEQFGDGQDNLGQAASKAAEAARLFQEQAAAKGTDMAVNTAAEDIKSGLGVQIPEHLRSPLFKGYVYPHDFENDYVPQQYLPDDLVGRQYYRYGENKTEAAAKAYWDKVKAEKPKKK